MAPEASESRGRARGKARRVDVAEGIFVYCTRRKGSVRYEVEVARVNRVEFTLCLSRIVNATYEVAKDAAKLSSGAPEDDSVRIRRVVQPFTRAEVATIRPKDTSQKTAVKTTFAWSLLPLDDEFVAKLVAENRTLLKKEIAASETYGFGDDSNSVAEVERRCITYKVNFLDADFPPCDASLYGPHGKDQLDLVWKRPRDFATEAEVFVGGVEPNDIRQGALADCWFLCALASLAEFESLVTRLFLPESRSLSRYGVYKVRFCKNGQWQSVMVDDYFPCYPGGGPAYGKAHGNELWVLLLEKAYAKLHGSYAAIRMGYAYEAMLDLTGAPYKTVRLDEETLEDPQSRTRLWESLLEWDQRGYVMSASTPGEDIYTETGKRPEKDGTGLVHGHAYTLLQVRQTTGEHQLLQVRNPWGNFEWTGDWSDNSELWTDELRKEVGTAFDDEDGAFWMSFEDVLKHFFSVNVCMVKNACANVAPWREQRRKVDVNYTEDGTVSSSSMYVLSLERSASLYVSVHQEDTRCANAKPYLDIGVTVLRILPDYTYELVSSSGNTAERQNQTDEIMLSPGEYLVVPTTTGCKFRQGVIEAKRAEEPNFRSLWRPGAEGRRYAAEAEHALNSVFRALDVDLDGVLNRDELASFVRLAEGCDAKPEVLDWLLTTFDSVDGEGLTPDGFRQCYTYMWDAGGRNDEVIWRDLLFHGYNRQLQLLYSRTIMLVVHADAAFEMHAQSFDPEAFEEAMELPIKAFGDCTHYEEAHVKLYVRRGGYNGVSIAVENVSDARIRFSLDMSGSENVTTHRQDLDYSEVVPAGEMKVMHHVMPTEPEKAWSWKYLPKIERLSS